MVKKVIVASKNPVKINSAKEVFSEYFSEVEVVGKKMDSEVSDQPRTDKETFQGAKNRAEKAFMQKEADFSVGIEGGLVVIGNQMFSYGWVYIKGKEKSSFAKTAAFPVPLKIRKLIEEGRELGEAGDIIFGIKNSKQKMGMIGLLSNSMLTRKEFYKQAIISALLPFLNPDLY